MSKMSDLALSIEEDILAEILSFQAIADRHYVPLKWVEDIAETVVDFPAMEEI